MKVDKRAKLRQDSGWEAKYTIDDYGTIRDDRKRAVYRAKKRDQWLERIYCDTTRLPVSLVKLDMANRELTCVELGEEQIKMYEIGPGRKKKSVMTARDLAYDEKGDYVKEVLVERDQEEIDVMATFTHPAIVKAVYDQHKEFFK